MIVSSSTHSIDIRGCLTSYKALRYRRQSIYDPYDPTEARPRPFNIANLIQILKCIDKPMKGHIEEEASEMDVGDGELHIGMKRKTNDLPTTIQPSPKKLKATFQESESESEIPLQDLPRQTIDVLYHTFEFKSHISDPTILNNQERVLYSLLQKKRVESDTKIALGRGIIISPAGSGCAFLHSSCHDLDESKDSESLLLNLPDIDHAGHVQDLDFAPREACIPAVCYSLKQTGKVAIDCTLSISIPGSQEDTPDGDHLSFLLMVDFKVSLIYPTIMQPIPAIPQGPRHTLAEAQRRLLTHIFSRQLPSTTTTVDIPFFYSSLEPAPHTNSTDIEAAAQPDDLLPTLLPFQRRSTHKLLQFEGKTLSLDGKVVDQSQASQHSDNYFYYTIEPLAVKSESNGKEREGVWYFNRLTGGLTEQRPEPLHFGCGGILAEEMGLGS